MSDVDTIYALSSAPGRAGIAVVRLSGPKAAAALEALAGRVPTASGLGVVPAADTAVASQRLRIVLSASAAYTVVHCCGGPAPFPEIRAAGAGAVSFDLAQLPARDTDRVAEIAEEGLGIFAGALPTRSAARLLTGPQLLPRETAEQVATLWRRTGLAPGRLTEQVVITPACGLAGASPAAARAALRHCREAARIVPEMIEAS